MTKKLLGVAVVAIVALTLGTVGAVADENVWVTKDDEEIVIGSGAHFMFSADDATTFDVSELADGETRTFGEGEKQVTVTRDGDEVTINHARGEGDSDHLIVCALSTDTCKIIQVDGDPGKTMVMIKKSHECHGSEHDCARVVMSHIDVAHAEPGQITIRKVIRCDEDGNCEESEDMSSFSAAHAEALATVEVFVDEANLDEMNNVLIVGDEIDGKRVLKLSHGDHVTLRCPEGDASLRVKKDEADETYLCPKHSLPMEKAAAPRGAHKILIREKVEDDNDD